MQPVHSSFSQPPPNNPNLLPTSYPQPSNFPPSHSLPQRDFPIQQLTPSGPFAAFSDPNKRFDGLDDTYTSEKVHTLPRVTFQLGP